MALTRASAAVIKTEEIVNNRNRIINGDMRIDQRNAGAIVTVNSTSQTFCTDRWWASGQSTDGVFVMAQSTNAPVGFSNSLQTSVTTADASIGTTQRYYIAQRIEAFNTADFSWGTANAKTVTLSFWVRSSLTGTFGGFIYNSDADYTYPFSYSISSADTWEQKTVTIEGPTAGTWLGSTNGVGMQIGWSLGTGTDRLGTAGAWTASQKFGATGQVNPIGTLNATWYITGVQLEVGSVATPFERRPYGTELSLCQRYYQTYQNPPLKGVQRTSDNRQNRMAMPLPVIMRAAPTTTVYGTLNWYNGVASGTCGAIEFSYTLPTSVEYDFALATGSVTNGAPSMIYNDGNANGINLTSEL